MVTTENSSTIVGLGFAVQTDPFQSGREAAQMAKNQIPGFAPSLVLAFGPSNIHFKDFIEGVRLVTGEDALVGIPTKQVVSKDLYSPNACLVVILHTTSMIFSTASTPLVPQQLISASTNLFSQLRTIRGNTRHQYENHGLMLITNDDQQTQDLIAPLVLSDAGLESWLVTIAPDQNAHCPLICHDQVLQPGAVALECLSDQPWGFGVVSVREFKDQPNIYQEAVKTALRDAKAQMGEHPASFGFLLFDFPEDRFNPADFATIFKGMEDTILNLPLVGLASRRPLVHTVQRADVSQPESVIAVLIPD